MARKKPIKPLGVIVIALMLLWFLAMIFGPRPLAAWLYETGAPVRDQVKTARFLIAAPFAVPLLLGLLWLGWHQRRDNRALRRRDHFAAKFAEPGHEQRLDSGHPDVD